MSFSLPNNKIFNNPFLLRIVAAGFWNGIGLVFTKLLMWGSMILFARLLSKEDFGYWGYLWSMFLMLVMFVDGPWSAAVTKYVAEYRNKEKEKAGQCIALYFMLMIPCSVLIIGVSFFSDLIAGKINHQNLASAVCIMLLSLIPYGFLSLIKGIINGLEEFRLNSMFLPLITFIDASVKIAGILTAGFRGLYISVIFSTLLQFFAGCIFCFIALKKHDIRIQLKGSCGFLSKFLNFTIPNLTYILVTCSGNMLVPSLFVKQPDGAVTMANFSVILQLQALLSFIPLMLASPILAVLSNAFSSDERKTWQSVKQLFMLFGGALFVCGAGIFCLARPLLLLYGESYAEAVPMLRLCIPAMILQIICPLYNQVFSALEHMWLMIATRIVWLLAYIAGAVFFIRSGLNGIVGATLVASVFWLFACQTGLFLIKVKKH